MLRTTQELAGRSRIGCSGATSDEYGPNGWSMDTPVARTRGRGAEIELLSAVRAGATGRGRGGVILMYIRIGVPSTRLEAQGLGGLFKI